MEREYIAGVNHHEMVRLAKAPPVENFAWLPVGVNYNKPARGSVSLI